MNLEITLPQDLRLEDCHVVVFDKNMKFVAQQYPRAPQPAPVDNPAEPTAPVIAPAPESESEYRLKAEFLPDQSAILVTVSPVTADVFVLGLAGWSKDRFFRVPEYQVREGKSFEVVATWTGGVERKVEVATFAPNKATPLPVTEPAPVAPVVPDTPVDPAEEGKPASNGLSFAFVAGTDVLDIELVKAGQFGHDLYTIRNRNHRDGDKYLIDSRCYINDLETEAFFPGVPVLVECWRGVDPRSPEYARRSDHLPHGEALFSLPLNS